MLKYQPSSQKKSMHNMSLPAAVLSRKYLWQLLQWKTALSFFCKTDRTTLIFLVDHMHVLPLRVDFRGARHIVVSTDITIKFKSCFIRPNKSGKNTFPSHMCKNHSQYSTICTVIMVCSNLGMYGSHFSLRTMIRTLVLQTPVSRGHYITDFLEDFITAHTLSQRLQSSVELWHLPERSFLFCTVPSA